MSIMIRRGMADCNVSARREAANCAAILSNCLTEVRKVDANDAYPSDALPDDEAVTNGQKSVSKKSEESPAA